MTDQPIRHLWIQLCVSRPSKAEPRFEFEVMQMEALGVRWAICQHGKGPRFAYSLWRRLSTDEINARARQYQNDSGRRYFIRHLRARLLGTVIRTNSWVT
jgi:hypothetical protein